MKKFLALAIVAVMTVALFAVGVQAADDFPYAHFVADGNDPCTGVTFSGAHTAMDPDAVKWAAIKYRTVTEKDSSGTALTGQIYVQPAQEPCVPINYVHSQSWETLVLDLSGCAAWNSEKYTQTGSFRFDFLQGNTVQKGDSIDIAWIAFFENEADAKAYDGTQDTPYCVSAPSDLAAKAGTNALQSVEVVGGVDEGAKVANQNFDVVNLTGPNLQLYGWVIIKGDDTIADMGYRIDDKDPVFSSLLDRSAEVSGVMGSDPAKTTGFDVKLSTDDIPAGDHVIHVVCKTSSGALLDVNQGDSDGFKVVGTGPKSSIAQPWFDNFSAEGNEFWARGWVIIADDDIEDIGYSVDGKDPVFSSLVDRSAEVSGVMGSDPAKTNGFEVKIAAADLPAGEHTVSVIVKTKGGELLKVNKDEADTFTFVGTGSEAEPETQSPATADAAVIAIAAVACVALAGVVIAKKVK